VLWVNAGAVVNYDTLLRQVWGELDSTDTQSANKLLKRLHRKLNDEAVRRTRTERPVPAQVRGALHRS